ncbi:MAG: hypothetical protein HW390_1666 [Candidatus Brocadiaceae bacterium]|nr:hypothetical protein [Candidatus Brocadiaceae bacterium]
MMTGKNKMEARTLLEWAKYYVEDKGFSVIPLKGKVPDASVLPQEKDENGRLKPTWKPYQKRKPTEAELQKWFGNGSKRNIGTVTGKISGIAVVDIDSELGMQCYRSMKLPKTPMVKTAKGRHAYFKNKKEIKNSQGCAELPDIDIRGSGGYIVAPPSIHPSGVQYTWIGSRSLEDLPLADFPVEIFTRLQLVEEDHTHNELVRKFGDPYYCNAKGEITSINQAYWAALYDNENILIYEPDEKAFYIYEEKTGLYRLISEALIKQNISNRMLEVSRENGVFCLEKKRTNGCLNQILGHVTGICEKRNAFKNKRKIVHLANGVIKFKKNTKADLVSFSPEFYSRNQSLIAYNKYAKCRRFLEELLLPAVSQEDALLIQKYSGLCLLGQNLIQRFLILDGLGGRGKTQLATVIQHIVGMENVTQLRTSHLDERFEMYRFLKKSLLVGVDVPGNFLSEKGAHVIKGLVGGDFFDAEQKNGTGCFQVKGNFCVLITSNSRLQLKLDGDITAWKRRLLIVRFEAPPPKKKIPDFADLLIREEGSGILNWALIGLSLLLVDIKETGDIRMAKNQRSIVNALLAESDSLRFFLKDCVESCDNKDLSVEEIVEAYAEYCPAKGWNAKPLTVVHKELAGLMLELFKTSKAHSISREGKNVRGFRRVRLKIRE